MKANELMIGDWVEINDIPKQIKFIDDCINHKIIAHGVNKDGKTIAYVGKLNEEVKLIPLTPEILEKNGFYYGYTSNEEDIASNTIAQLWEEEKGWVWDEGVGSVKVIFPNESDGGEIQICDQSFDRNMVFGFSENIMLHELQHALRLCRIEKEIEL